MINLNLKSQLLEKILKPMEDMPKQSTQITGNQTQKGDFTINAIYLDKDGKLFDPQLGVNDLKNKNIKFIGDPQKRIEEDYLRIIRFIRFKIMYDFKIEQTTAKAIKQNLNGIKKFQKREF